MALFGVDLNMIGLNKCRRLSKTHKVYSLKTKVITATIQSQYVWLYVEWRL